MVDRKQTESHGGKRATVKIVGADGKPSKKHYVEDNYGGGQTAARQTDSMLGPLSSDAAALRRKKNDAYWELNEKK